jgi:hypothetical protein
MHPEINPAGQSASVLSPRRSSGELRPGCLSCGMSFTGDVFDILGDLHEFLQCADFISLVLIDLGICMLLEYRLH